MAELFPWRARGENQCPMWDAKYEVRCDLEIGHGDSHICWSAVSLTWMPREWDTAALEGHDG